VVPEPFKNIDAPVIKLKLFQRKFGSVPLFKKNGTRNQLQPSKT
jgi:hypothetical protein